MPCEAHLFLYYDLEGKPTGEYSLECVGDCPQGTCRKKTREEENDRRKRVYCACVDQNGTELPSDHCSIELVINDLGGGRVELVPACCSKPCAKCSSCRVVSYGKTVTIVDEA